MRCQDCAKFASLEPGDVEVSSLEVSNEEGSGRVTATIRIVLVCADCNTELKENNFEVDETITIEHAEGCDKVAQELEVEFEPEAMDEFIPPKAKRQKHMYGAEGTITVTCPCKAVGTHPWKDTVQSSHMEEIG